MRLLASFAVSIWGAIDRRWTLDEYSYFQRLVTQKIFLSHYQDREVAFQHGADNQRYNEYSLANAYYPLADWGYMTMTQRK